MKFKVKDYVKIGFREKLIILCPAVVLAIFAFFVVYYFVDPFPPRRISIGCGPPEGANFSYAQAYREILSREGIGLELRNTAGSAENLQLLGAASGGVDIAFVQGSMKSSAQDTDLVSLGSLFFEPLWIFHRNDLALRRIPDLKGLRLAVGEEGGGTKILTMRLLELNGVNSQNTRILSYGYQKAADKLLNGEVDVAFFVSTQLVARSDLHPALINLILTAAKVVHKFGGEFEREGEFPAPKYLDFKLSTDAERFYKFGPPFLQRYLPFWIAIFVSRMVMLLLPLAAVFFPFFKLMPLIYRWRMRSKIYRWYSKLRAFDPERHKEEAAEQLQEYLAKLDRIEEKVSNISVPLSFSEELYHLRMHIDMLRNKLIQMINNGP
jgi:hypothetical protein